MRRWQAELTGHRFDLDDLRRLLTADDLRVVKDDGTFYLDAAEFEELTDGAAVYRAAVDLLSLLNGVGKLHSPPSRMSASGTCASLARTERRGITR